MYILGKDYDFKNPEDGYQAINKILIKKMKKFPVFVNLLMFQSDILDTKEFKHAEGRDALAFTYLDLKTKRFKIFLNFDRIDSGIQTPGGKIVEINEDRLFFLIMHELLHQMYMHFTRQSLKEFSDKQPKLTNIVMDYYINEFLINSSLFDSRDDVKSFVKEMGAITHDYMEKAAREVSGGKTGMPFNSIYKDDAMLETSLLEWFMKQWQDNPQSKGKGQGQGQGGSGNGELDDALPEGGNTMDDHDVSRFAKGKNREETNKEQEEKGERPLSEQESDTLSENVAKGKLDAAQQSSKSQSDDEAAFGRKVNKLFKKDPTLDFMKIKNIINKLTSDIKKLSYSRCNKKRVDDTIVFKGKKKKGAAKLIVAIDVSGSVSDKELAVIYNMLRNYMKKMKNTVSMDVLFWSCGELKKGIHTYDNITDFEELKKLKVHSNGGTVIEPLYNYIEENYKGQNVSMLNITDGYYYYVPTPSVVKQHYIVLSTKQTYETITGYYNGISEHPKIVIGKLFEE